MCEKQNCNCVGETRTTSFQTETLCVSKHCFKNLHLLKRLSRKWGVTLTQLRVTEVFALMILKGLIAGLFLESGRIYLKSATP